MLQVIPDWHRTGTLDEIEAYVGNGLLLRSGLGFYLSDTDTMLLVANSESPLGRYQIEGAAYTLYVWNVPFHQTVMGQGNGIRTRRDSRK